MPAHVAALSRVRPENLVLWIGAGISADAPTNGPLGRTLTDRALNHYFAPGTRETLVSLYAELDAPNAKYRPRLETVLDVLVDAHGLDALTDVLSDLSTAAPNRHHARVAKLQLAGTGVVTANFDTCIERATAHPVEVVHFHGDIGPYGSIATLGARLQVIEHGFTKAMLKALQKTLERSDGGTLAFIGYSGSDFFDATPFLTTFFSRAAPRQIIWHKYSSHSLTIRKPNSDDGEIVARAMAAGNKVLIAQGTLDDFFETLVDDKFHHSSTPSHGVKTRAWKGRILPSEAERLRATALLFGKLGYRSGTIEAFRKSPPTSMNEHELLADAHWGRGEYREALRHWRVAISGTTRDAKARRSEREGAVLWVTGRLVRAEKLLWRALMEFSACSSPVSPDVEAALLETYGRVVEHMRRNPDTRLFVPTRRAYFAGMRARALAAAKRDRLGQLAAIGLDNVVATYEGESDPTLEHSVDTFQEREALHGWLNYRHAMLRARAGGHSVLDLPTAAEYRMQAQRELAIGARADHMRAMILPGAAPHFSMSEFLQAQRRVEMSPWNRLRFIAGFAASHFRPQITDLKNTMLGSLFGGR